ncbi:hypothetical protein [Bacillus sp. JJ722]|uniref:hypothetical protein n=1 Tax=Bacillus sp. JJ722 TaxID=3122973 RepID=UPI002FFEC19F
MDKLDRNNTIKIKLNGNAKVYEEKVVNDVVIVEKESVVDSNQEEQIQQEEKDSAMEEMAAANQTNDEAFDWVLPTTSTPTEPKSEVPNSSPVFTYTSDKKQKKSNRSEYPKFIVAIVFAVVIGLGFMYVALKTITASDSTKTVDKPIVAEKTKEEPISKPSTTNVSMPPLTIQAVQGGVYSNRESAEKQRDILEDRKLPAVILAQQNKYYLLLFVADSLDRAKAVSSLYKEKGIDSYWKEFEIGVTGKKNVTEADANILKASLVLYNELTSAGTNLMLSSERSDVQKFQTSLQKIQSLKKGSEDVLALVTPLNLAVKELTNTKDPIEASFLLQKNLLQFIMMYNALKQ